MTDQVECGSQSREVVVSDELDPVLRQHTGAQSAEIVVSDESDPTRKHHVTTQVRETIASLPPDVYFGASTHVVETVIADEPPPTQPYGYPEFATAIKEAVIHEVVRSFAHESRETLVDIPDDPISLRYLTARVTLDAIQAKEVADPSTVRSEIPVAALVQMTVSGREISTPITDEFFAQAASLVTQGVATTPPADVISPVTTGQAVSLTVMSRIHEHEGDDSIHVRASFSLASQACDFSPPMHGPHVAQEFQLTAIARDEIPEQIGDIEVASTTWLVVQSRGENPLPNGEQAAQEVQLVAQEREVPEPYSSVLAISDQQLVAQQREMPDSTSPRQVRAERQLVAQGRDTLDPDQVTNEQVRSEHQLVVQHRDTEPHYSPPIASSMRTLVVQRRDTLDPDVVRDNRLGSLESRVVQHKDTTPAPDVWSPIRCSHLNVQYALGRNLPPPWEVIDPSVGVHVKRIDRLNVTHRPTTPPPASDPAERQLRQVVEMLLIRDTEFEPVSRANLFEVAQPVVVGDDQFGELTDGSDARLYDTFEVPVLGESNWADPNEPASEINLFATWQNALVEQGEGWLDPTVPNSNANLYWTWQSPVVGEETGWLDPTVPNSDANLYCTWELPILGDEKDWFDPNEPRSAAGLFSTWESVLFADVDGLLDPTAPRSSAGVISITSYSVVGDPAMWDFPMGRAQVGLLVQRVVVRDSSLVGLPAKRPNRPVVSIFMS